MSFDAALILPSLLVELDVKGVAIFPKPTPQQIVDVEQRMTTAVAIYLQHWAMHPKESNQHICMTVPEDCTAACSVVLSKHGMVMTGIAERTKKSLNVYFKRLATFD